ncbi:2OG-Fe(II) oxygenase family protein [Polaribacter septentrionalilitoris]|uniref:2OG-Fe(II) oxygenase family protein n=1 Tax=Polaribacter septentrionalilitoris TaxID=2494657 RepID=UPI00135969C0|nr:2OG-Fe(II) oxygenase family protein [Polaribacter septentrionalilitoris]
MNPIITELYFSKKSNLKIRTALLNFVKKDSKYKKQFLQSRYNTAFDGYSYIGQKDSLNQYENDMLHSFVISEFQNIEDFPKEFHSFLKDDWEKLISTVKNAELTKIKELNIPELTQLYKDNIIGYMMSCNYYPKPINCKSNAKNNTRLSAHKDVSLFTTFPYGVDNGLSVLDINNNYVEIDKKEKTFLFSGYFLEFMTHKKIPALNHQVNLPKDLESERFSFAVFSIPKPNTTFSGNGMAINSTDYYKKYLSLF